ncbi:MAG: hypothetical protein LBC27_05335 [Spirochaetaceae bacterium]|jgi:hypothetical protein|nr:hypothetical protein [Spirochaetaceae bacterium]
MGIIKSTVRVGQKPPKEVIEAARKATRGRINYTEDAPRSTPEALAEFAALRAVQKKKDIRTVVTLRLMADVLAAAIDNPEVLSRLTRQ